jgi:RND family efflux transporter MFP subunit
MPIVQEIEPPGNTGLHSPSHVPAVEHPPSLEHDAVLQRPQTAFSRTTILAIFSLAVVAFVGLFFLGWVPRKQLFAELEADSERIRSTRPLVRVVKPRVSSTIATVMLPGDVQAMEEITIYPRTTGYLKRWLVDIGDEVREGQLLAEVDTPEVRAQLQQSQAALAESKASLERVRATVKLARINVNRVRGLAEKKAIAQQELDDAENALDVAVANEKLGEATIEANTANVQHIQELLTFSEIRSSFAGTVTARHVDTGKLVTSGNGTGQAIFQVARTNPVRVFINVPQNFAPGVSNGLKAGIVARELPGRVFHGVVTRTARAIDPVTRTLLTEIHVPNDDHALLTGSYVQVRLEVARQHPSLIIPASALVFNASGNQVAVVGPDQQLELRAVHVAEDFGSEIGITTGITADDNIIVNPGDRLSDGVKVEIETDQIPPNPKPEPTDNKHAAK